MRESRQRPAETLERNLVIEMLFVGKELDLNEGGYFDSRSSVVNCWCGPDNKPSCWPADIKQGSLKFPRDYVGGIYFVQESGSGNMWKVWVDVTPYSLKDSLGFGEEITESQWDECFRWMETQKDKLISIAKMKLSEQML